MYKFTTVEALASRIRQYQQTDASFNSFNRGLSEAEIWGLLNSFNINSLEQDNYSFQKRQKEILAGVPESVACGADIPIVGGNYTRQRVFYTPFKRRIALQLCKSDCGPQNFEEKYNQAQYEVGASFGKMYESVLWLGDAYASPGITQTQGVEFSNLSATDYANIDTQDAIKIANMISMLAAGMMDPVIIHGPITAELIGWRSQSTTGDNCGDIWQCVLSQLGQRFGESQAAITSRFKSVQAFDNIIGLDSAAPTDPHAAFLVIDRAYARMGASRTVEQGSVWTEGADLSNAERCMAMTAPQILKQGGARFAFGFLDHAKIIAAEGMRYGDDGLPVITVPTPLV